MSNDQALADAIREAATSLSASMGEGFDALALATGDPFGDRQLAKAINEHATDVRAGLCHVSTAIRDLAAAVRAHAAASEKAAQNGSQGA